MSGDFSFYKPLFFKESFLRKFISFIKNKIFPKILSQPVYIKAILAPPVFIISFLIVLPVVAAAALIYKFISVIVSFITHFKTFVILKILLWFLAGTAVFTIIFSIPTVLYYALSIVLPAPFSTILRIAAISGCMYMIFLYFVLSKDVTEDVETIFKHEDEFDIDDAKNILEEASGEKANKNPILWLLNRGAFLWQVIASFILTSGVFIIMLFSISLDGMFPGVFFTLPEDKKGIFIKWLLFYLQELLNVIPVKFAAPFVPEFDSLKATKPWGGIVMVFCQAGMVVLLYLSVFLVYVSYKKKLKDAKVKSALKQDDI
jgi:hypothetical protein